MVSNFNIDCPIILRVASLPANRYGAEYIFPRYEIKHSLEIFLASSRMTRYSGTPFIGLSPSALKRSRGISCVVPCTSEFTLLSHVSAWVLISENELNFVPRKKSLLTYPTVFSILPFVCGRTGRHK